MKHRRVWFKNRMGKKVYCDDHPNENVGWYECKGIKIESDLVAENLWKMQNWGVNFSD